MDSHGVDRIDSLNRFTQPSRYLAVHMIECVPRTGLSVAPIGITSA